jgi:hypothetical protein
MITEPLGHGYHSVSVTRKGRIIMRNKISGAIAIIWGGYILVNWFLSGRSYENAAYQSGQNGAAILGGLLFIAGIYYFFKKPKDKSTNKAK